MNVPHAQRAEGDKMKKVRVLLDNGEEVTGRFLSKVAEFNEPWEPEDDEHRGFIFSDGHVGFRRFDDICNADCDTLKCGNYFKTREIAEHEAKRESLMRRMRNFARANGKIDWENKSQPKFALYYEYGLESIWATQVEMYCPEKVYFVGHKLAEEAIRRFSDEIIALYKEEENA